MASSDTPGRASRDVTRPDLEPTINEDGADGFVIDGTDSFAVPGPADGSPREGGPEAPAISRTRLLATAGAVVVGLVFVVAVGRDSGAEEAQLRTEGGNDGGSGPGFSIPLWGDGDDRPATLALPGPDDDETLRRLGDAPSSSTDDALSGDERIGTLDDDLAGPYTDESYPGYSDVTEGEGDEDSFDDESFDDESFDDRSFDDESFDLDEDGEFPSYRPVTTAARRPTAPRRIPVVTVPRTTTPPTVASTTTSTAPTTTTTTVAATTTTAPTTTTTSTTTTPTTTTTQPPATVPVPPGPWVDASAGLECSTTLRLWTRPGGLVATADGGLHALVDGTWADLDGPDGAVVRAFEPGVDDSRFWVGTDRGVFATTDAGDNYSPVGGPMDVSSLSVAPNGTSMLAVTIGGLMRWDGSAQSPAWTSVTVPGQGITLGEVLLVDDTTAVLGTSGGVLRSTDGGSSWASVTQTPVVGAPVLDTGALHWLAAGGGGVLRSADDGAIWTNIAPSNTVATNSRALAVLGGQVVTPGVTPNQLIALTAAGSGAPWTATPFGPLTTRPPGGLVRQGTSTYAFVTSCGGTALVERLADP